MTRNTSADWYTLAMDSWSLWYEANQVIWMRMMRLSSGGALAERESRRMVEEKITATTELAAKMMTGSIMPTVQGANTSVKHYRTKVRANQRRLAK